MGIKLETRAVEQSAYGITVSFFDSDGAAATPKTLSWSLTDAAGAVINNRQDVVIANPSSTETIVLTGDDLQMIDAGRDSERRLLLIEATYDDIVLGVDCPLREEIAFFVVNRTEAA